eukprot:2525459-Rhodomonas_salina.1
MFPDSSVIKNTLGDQHLGGTNCLQAQMAQSSLGVPTQVTLQPEQDPEERALKKRRMLAEVKAMEKRNEEYTLQ